MPEGDAVWRTARRLQSMDGHLLTRTDFRVPQHATADLSGAVILTTVSRGKHLLTRFDSGVTLHTHLGMDGTWAVQPAGSRWRRPAFTARVVLTTCELEAVGFQLRCDLVRTAEEDRLVGHLGPDLLGPDWDPAVAVRLLRSRPEIPVAVALLDQRNLAGVGNIYANEVCFLAGVDPATPIGEITDKLDRVVELAHRLLEANKDRTVRDTTGLRRRGADTWVYRRRGPCLRCGTPIRHRELGGAGTERSTWWCPACQTGMSAP
jgi:endonuclease-8